MNNNTGQNKINLQCIIRDVLRDIWVAVIVGISVSLLAYVVANFTYSPTYTSRTTFVVSAKGSTTGPYGDITKVEKLTEVFKSVMDSQVLKRLVNEKLEMDSFPGTVGISVVPETNLLTVSVTAGSPDVAFRLLNTLLECYPTVGKDVLGEVVLEVFEEPTFPGAPNETVQSKKVVFYGFAAGMAVMVALLAMISYLKNTVKSRQDITEKLDTTEIATLYHEKKYRNLKDCLRRKKKLILLTEPSVGFGYSETVKKVRTKFLYQMKKKGIKIIYVSSTLAGEGKTTVALNLAEAMAQRYENVLLIEGDTRKTELAKKLSLEEGSFPDWGRYFERGKALKDAIYKLDNHKFQVLVNGSEKRFTTEMLASNKMKTFLDEMREQMDVIIIDGPPARKRSDAEVLARISDASVLVVKQNMAHVKYINDTIDMLNAYGEGLLGCIFNDVVSAGELFSSGYGYGYGYGYRYGYGYGRYGRYGKYGKYGNYYKGREKGEEHESD